MTTSFLPAEKCVISSVLHQQSNILKEWHPINIHGKFMVEKGGSALSTFHLVTYLFSYILQHKTCRRKHKHKKKINLQTCLCI